MPRGQPACRDTHIHVAPRPAILLAMRLGLAGDTMLGRKVGDAIRAGGVRTLFSAQVVAAAREADLFVLNLECCISGRGEPWPDPRKPFFFRAPPAAVEALTLLGVDAVTLANNHALDYGPEALADTLDLLAGAGIAAVGAGADAETARRPVVVEHAGLRLGIVAFTDHPADFAATEDRPGVAYADLRRGGVPAWVTATIAGLDADAALVTPHWGPNMTTAPPHHVRRAAGDLAAAGAALIAGHSAHVFHGAAAGGVLFDLGDFVDDYAVDPDLRNDLGLLWFVEVDAGGVRSVEALPLALDYCHTRVADPGESDWIGRRLTAACRELGTTVAQVAGRFVIS